MKCAYCSEEVTSGVITHGYPYCNQECADTHWREELADIWAENESGGLYHTYEDYMENERGAVIADDHYYPRPSDY